MTASYTDMTKQRTRKAKKMAKHKSLTNKNNKIDKRTNRKTGPRLPAALLRELDHIKPKHHLDGEEDEDIVSDEENDLYEYEEGVPEEESKKNRRYDPVENYQYELPRQFKVSFSITFLEIH